MRREEAADYADHLETVHGRTIIGIVNAISMLRERKAGIPCWLPPAQAWLILIRDEDGDTNLVANATPAEASLVDACMPFVNRTREWCDGPTLMDRFETACSCYGALTAEKGAA